MRSRGLAILLLVLVVSTGCNRNAESAKVGGPSATPATATPASAEPFIVEGSKGLAARIGYTAPDFSLLDIHDKTHNLSDYRGRVVLLNFWATWCGPCRIEMPSLQALYEDYGRDKFEVLAVAADVDGKPQVAPFINRLRLTFPALIDADARVQERYYVNAFPMTYVLDKDGVVVYKFVGFFDWNSAKYRTLLTDLMARI